MISALVILFLERMCLRLACVWTLLKQFFVRYTRERTLLLWFLLSEKNFDVDCVFRLLQSGFL